MASQLVKLSISRPLLYRMRWAAPFKIWIFWTWFASFTAVVSGFMFPSSDQTSLLSSCWPAFASKESIKNNGATTTRTTTQTQTTITKSHHRHVDVVTCSSRSRPITYQDDACCSILQNCSSTRRWILFSLAGSVLFPGHAVAEPEELPPEQQQQQQHQQQQPVEETIVLRGTVTTVANMMPPLDPLAYPNAALYITCRPNKPDNVPEAILRGTRGKAPPVLAAKILTHPTNFPLDFALSVPRDLTPEGATDGISNTVVILDPQRLWWKDLDLVVSARWDSDGSVTTRSPEDLVARGVAPAPPADADAAATGQQQPRSTTLQLTGRGAFGKFATGGGGKE